MTSTIHLSHQQRPDGGIALVWSEHKAGAATPVLTSTHPVILETIDADLNNEQSTTRARLRCSPPTAQGRPVGG